MGKKSIYILRDPTSQEVKYVGASSNPHKRLVAHRSNNYQATSTWVNDLKSQGLEPQLEVVSEPTDHWRLLEKETIESHDGLLNGRTASVPHTEYHVRKAFGQAVERARMAAGMTQSQVATAMGKHQHTISQWESGSRTPSTPNQYALASALGLEGGPADIYEDMPTPQDIAAQVNQIKKGNDGKRQEEE